MPDHHDLASDSLDPSSVGTEGGVTAQTFTTEKLFQAASEVWIRHGGEIYRLRITKAGKLILNK